MFWLIERICMIHKTQILLAPSEKGLCSYMCNVFHGTKFTSLYQKNIVKNVQMLKLKEFCRKIGVCKKYFLIKESLVLVLKTQQTDQFHDPQVYLESFHKCFSSFSL